LNVNAADRVSNYHVRRGNVGGVKQIVQFTCDLDRIATAIAGSTPNDACPVVTADPAKLCNLRLDKAPV